ncbi:MAG: aspartate aminotransferase family protein [Myxococcales bacterium]|nr:aspartate aminotransferase family protein [Myxococcales bacterium]MCB9752695.1 aspartate aminotransferase family protein [Myxococcales bacterium]
MGVTKVADPSALFDRQREHLFFTWSAQRDVLPLTIVEAAGPRFRTLEDGWLWDLESQVYNVNVGHGHAHVKARMVAQIGTLPAAAPNAVLPIRAELGALLGARTGLHRAFLTTGGSEAVENAIKIARLVTGRSKIITRRNSYHGATLAALGVAGDVRKLPFARDLAPAYHVDDPYPWVDETPSSWVRNLTATLEREGPETVAAVLLEGFTGTNGMQPPPPDFWPQAHALCSAHGVLLIDDEIFSGFGRTGRWFAHEHFLAGAMPDMMVIGKGLTSGYAPLAGVVVSHAIAEHFERNKLWCGLTTYAHPVSCAAAVGAIEALDRDGLIDNARARGEQLGGRLRALVRSLEVVVDARGLGLMWAVELNRPAAPLHALYRERGAYVPYRDQTLFVCPPLCVTAADIDAIVDLLAAGLRMA